MNQLNASVAIIRRNNTPRPTIPSTLFHNPQNSIPSKPNRKPTPSTNTSRPRRIKRAPGRAAKLGPRSVRVELELDAVVLVGNVLGDTSRGSLFHVLHLVGHCFCVLDFRAAAARVAPDDLVGKGFVGLGCEGECEDGGEECGELHLGVGSWNWN